MSYEHVPVPAPEVPDDVLQCLGAAQQLLDVIRGIEAQGGLVAAGNSQLTITWPTSSEGTCSAVQCWQADSVRSGRSRPRRWEVTTTWRQES